MRLCGKTHFASLGNQINLNYKQIRNIFHDRKVITVNIVSNNKNAYKVVLNIVIPDNTSPRTVALPSF